MAYNESLAEPIRERLGSEPDVTEKKMFGGLAFLVNGNMAISANSQGGALVRVDPQRSEELTASGEAQATEMHGRLMPGWLRVGIEYLGTDQDLERWIGHGLRMLAPCRPNKRRIALNLRLNWLDLAVP